MVLAKTSIMRFPKDINIISHLSENEAYRPTVMCHHQAQFSTNISQQVLLTRNPFENLTNRSAWFKKPYSICTRHEGVGVHRLQRRPVDTYPSSQ